MRILEASTACLLDSVIDSLRPERRSIHGFVYYLLRCASEERFRSFSRRGSGTTCSQANCCPIKFRLPTCDAADSDRRHPLRLRRPDREQPAADCAVGGGGADALPRVVRPLPLPRPRTRQDHRRPPRGVGARTCGDVCDALQAVRPHSKPDCWTTDDIVIVPMQR